MRTTFKLFAPLLLAPAFLSGPAHALSCSLSNLASCNQSQNGVQFSNFTFSGFTADAGDTFEFTGSLTGNSRVSVNFNPARKTIPTGSFGYTATLIPTPLFRYTFNTAAVSTDSQFIDPTPPTPASILTTSLASSGLPLAPTLTLTGTSSTTTNQNASFNPSLSTLTFTQNFSINALGADETFQITGTFRAKANPVPGPLPLLGAATAFGLSRKLRSRIRSAA
jgi:hypothetical protein